METISQKMDAGVGGGIDRNYAYRTNLIFAVAATRTTELCVEYLRNLYEQHLPVTKRSEEKVISNLHY